MSDNDKCPTCGIAREHDGPHYHEALKQAGKPMCPDPFHDPELGDIHKLHTSKGEIPMPDTTGAERVTAAVGKAFYITIPEAGRYGMSVSDDGGKRWRRLTPDERTGAVNDAFDAFILTLIAAGELERVHTTEGERPYFVDNTNE